MNLCNKYRIFKQIYPNIHIGVTTFNNLKNYKNVNNNIFINNNKKEKILINMEKVFLLDEYSHLDVMSQLHSSNSLK